MSIPISFSSKYIENKNISSSNEVEFKDYFIKNDYISLEDLEKRINKEALLCFSNNISSANNKKEQNNILQSLLKERPTDCVVCAKQAKCCYFDVPCCLGCRSFFRRSVLSQRLVTCKNNENCQIQQGERCRACRFDRCLLVGMDFRKIQNFPDGIEIDKIKNILNERKRQIFSRKALTLRNEENSIIMNKNFLSERPEIELLNILAYADECLLHIRHSEIGVSTIYYEKSIFDLLASDGETQSFLSKSNMFSKKKRIPKSCDFFIQQFKEEIIFSQISGSPTGRPFFPPIWLYIDSFLFIEMTKTLPVLNQLSLEDKIMLYSKNGFAAIVFSQLFYSKIIHESEILIFPNGFSPLFINNNETIYNLFYNHMTRIKEANLSKEEFLLLRTAIFFHTASTELSSIGCKTLQIEHDRLSQALMFYERSRCGDIDGAKRYADLMLLINMTFQIGSSHQKFLKNLMIKLNDLKLFFPKFMQNIIFDEEETIY